MFVKIKLSFIYSYYCLWNIVSNSCILRQKQLNSCLIQLLYIALEFGCMQLSNIQFKRRVMIKISIISLLRTLRCMIKYRLIILHKIKFQRRNYIHHKQNQASENYETNAQFWKLSKFKYRIILTILDNNKIQKYCRRTNIFYRN